MDSPFYKSDYLRRTIYFPEIDTLSEHDIASLRAELKIAVSSMQEKMHAERDTATSDWLYGISLKINVCEQFLERIEEVRSVDTVDLNHYYLLHLKQQVTNALGPQASQKLFNKARHGALNQLRSESKS